MPPEPTMFDDPALKAAVKRAWGVERAPAALRQRIESQLTQSSSSVIRVAPSIWRRSFVFGLAAAAVVVIAVGLVAMKKGGSDHPGVQVNSVDPKQSTASLPPQLANELVRRHDACIRLAPHDHHFFTAAPKDNFNAIARGMSAELRHPVLATPVGIGWDFRGAALCPVGQTKSAHLVYAHGDAFVSVFSLGSSAASTLPDHQSCDAAVNGHPVAGFVEAGGFYCVVASTGGKTPIDLEQVRAIRDQLRTQVAALHHLDHVHLAHAHR